MKLITQPVKTNEQTYQSTDIWLGYNRHWFTESGAQDPRKLHTCPDKVTHLQLPSQDLAPGSYEPLPDNKIGQLPVKGGSLSILQH